MSLAPAAATAEPTKLATDPEEALQQTYEALMQGAGPWDTSAVQEPYKKKLRCDFSEWFGTHWATRGDAVKFAARATGVLAVLIAKGTGATNHVLSEEHVFMASAIVKASKASVGDKPGFQDEPRGRFCHKADFGKVGHALEALLKEYPPR